MRIAILAPLTRPVKSDTRGSRPRLIYDLVRFLVKKGHKVTTFGTGDSQVDGDLVKVIPKAIYLMPPAENPFYQHTVYLAKLITIFAQNAHRFDIVHNHVYPEFLPVLISPFIKTPILTTIHLPIIKPMEEVLRYYPNVYFTSVSNHQRQGIRGVNFMATVYNGIDTQEFPAKIEKGKYLLFFGRMKESDPKGVLTAIKVAQKTGENLKIAGNVESPDFYKKEIEPHLNEKIQFVGPVDAVGPIGFQEKIKLYQNAKALLFPINWEEPFGMTMIEAMSCGTPVIAFDRGAVREVIKDGQTGFICPTGDLESMIEAVGKIDQINRQKCHQHVRENFTIEKMVNHFLELYKKILAKRI